MLVAFVVSGPIRAERPDGQKQKKHSKYQHVVDEPRASALDIQVVFSQYEVRVIREHYATRYRNLPPGLQKKMRRTGQLPPGWQKKLEPFPVVVERELAVLPTGHGRGVIDGHAVIYNQTTHRIIDVTVLF